MDSGYEDVGSGYDKRWGLAGGWVCRATENPTFTLGENSGQPICWARWVPSIITSFNQPSFRILVTRILPSILPNIYPFLFESRSRVEVDCTRNRLDFWFEKNIILYKNRTNQKNKKKSANLKQFV